jgi:3',5'-cyclic AMP phosphodiesterase CpdA
MTTLSQSFVFTWPRVRSLTPIAVAAFFLNLAGASRASHVSFLDPDYSAGRPFYVSASLEKVKEIVYPVMGFPELLVAGSELTIVVELDDGGVTQDWEVSISTQDVVWQKYQLPMDQVVFDAAAGQYRLQAVVPPEVPRDVFGLRVTSGSAGVDDLQPNAVRVIREQKNDFRIIQLTDYQIGDPTGPLTPPNRQNRFISFVRAWKKALEEIAFLDPEFVIYTGDLAFGSLYPLQYEIAWELFQDQGVSTFFVPGNHDGSLHIGGGFRDGLEFWKQMVGPLDYAFTYGDRLTFLGINSYSGPASRRWSINFIPRQWGGSLDEEQLDWAAAQIQVATQAGRDVILFLHHDPRGNIHHFGGPMSPADEDGDGYAEATEPGDVLYYQEWNDRESGQAFLEIIASANSLFRDGLSEGRVSHLFFGHNHADYVDYDVATDAWFIHTTSVGVGHDPSNYWGYRVIEFEDGRVSAVNVEAPEFVELPPGEKGSGLQSFPVNNIRIALTRGSNEGSCRRVTQKVANSSPIPVAGKLKFFMPQLPGEDDPSNNFGYAVSGGMVQHVAKSGLHGQGDKLIFYVAVLIDANDRKEVSLTPNE